MKTKKLTKTQQLKLIEAICLIHGTETKNPETRIILENIYKIAHLNSTCKNKHLDWHKEGQDLIKFFNKNSIAKI